MSTKPSGPPTAQSALPRTLPSWTGYLIGPVFLLLAAWFVWGPDGLDLPAGRVMAFDRSRLTTAPRRKILNDPPTIIIDGFERTCMDCHRMFPPRSDTPVRLLQHGHVVLDHGINDRCRNCHYEKDRNKLVLYGGEVIGYEQVATLCAKCHGPRYRERQHGAHGLTNGYWDNTRGEGRRLGCTECHNPHNPRVPAMDSLEPLPGPHTLRMGEPTRREHADFTVLRDPLPKHANGGQLPQTLTGTTESEPGAHEREDSNQ